MPLTDMACKQAACPGEKLRQRFTDSGGLYLEVARTGSKRRFWKYVCATKEKRIALGSYPIVGVKAARAARDSARILQQSGTDPAQQRQLEKLHTKTQGDNSFEVVAREFYKVKKDSWSSTYVKRWIERMEKDAFPWIGGEALDKITAPVLLQVLRRVEGGGQGRQ